MAQSAFPVRGLDDDRLAAHVTTAAPAWLWSADGARVLWANPTGCAVFSGEPAGLATRIFAPQAPIRMEVERLAAMLPRNGPARLHAIPPAESATAWRNPLLCACSLIPLDGQDGVLMAATEAIGPALSLAERVQRLDLEGDAAVAMPDGTILRTTGDAVRRLAGTTSIADISAMPLIPAALASGFAAGCTEAGPVTLRRIGSGAATLMLLRFDFAENNVAPAAGYEPARSDSPATAPGQTKPAISIAASGGDALLEPGTLHLPNSRRFPLRLVWQMDRDGRFTLGSEQFTEIIGTRSAIALGRPWEEINAALGLDPADRFAQAVARRDTFSHIMMSWPVDEGAERIEVEFSGLPAFDRGRVFLGYRGFGVCRDVDRIESLREKRRRARLAPGAQASQSAPGSSASPPAGVKESPARIVENILPFPGSSGIGERSSDCKSLSPGECHAFDELTRELTARLRGEAPDGAGAGKEIGPLAAADNRVAATTQPPAAADGDNHTGLTDAGLLFRLPVGLIIYRPEKLVFANRACLAMADYADFAALEDAGGLNALFPHSGIGLLAESSDSARILTMVTRPGSRLRVEGRLAAVHWNGAPAFAVVLTGAEQGEQKDIANTSDPGTRHGSTALATLCHDARVPLNSILGLCEMMLEERYGPLGNERYRAYLADIRKATTLLMMRLADALDLAAIQAGTFDLSPAAVDLNDVVNECVLAMHAQANAARVVVRVALAASVHKVLADIASTRKIVATLLGHAIRQTRPGGQVIVSTGTSPAGDAVVRLRDNGEGLSEDAIAAALEPSGPPATTPPWSGAGSILPLAKALAEANHARLKITSKLGEGSLFEVAFAARADTGDSLSASA